MLPWLCLVFALVCFLIGVILLEKLTRIVLNEYLNKNIFTKYSKWPNARFSSEQLLCTALDTIKRPQIYFSMRKFQNLTLRLERSDFEDDMEVYVVPLNVNMNNLSCVAKNGNITKMKK